MKKSKRLQLYCYTHKIPDYGLVDDEIHTPVHVGKALTDKYICEVGDDTGDNISELNWSMRELTGMYWVWKNVKDVSFVGSEHYRRRFGLSYEDILNKLKTYDLITFNRNHLNPEWTVMVNYFLCHSPIDLITVEFLVKKFYPNYASDWDKYIGQGHELFNANCFICKKSLYDAACSFVFDILFKFIDTFAIDNKEQLDKHVETFSQQVCPPDKINEGWDWIRYQEGICGFLAERLFTLFIMHNIKQEKILETKIIEMEDNNKLWQI